jgi:hypothetical protein
MANLTLFLLDYSTPRITDPSLNGRTVDAVEPTATQTFVISERLDQSRNYTAIVSSDWEDESLWTWVGQFM